MVHDESWWIYMSESRKSSRRERSMFRSWFSHFFRTNPSTAGVNSIKHPVFFRLNSIYLPVCTYFKANQTQMQRFWRTTNALYSIDFQIQRYFATFLIDLYSLGQKRIHIFSINLRRDRLQLSSILLQSFDKWPCLMKVRPCQWQQSRESRSWLKTVFSLLSRVKAIAFNRLSMTNRSSFRQARRFHCLTNIITRSSNFNTQLLVRASDFSPVRPFPFVSFLGSAAHIENFFVRLSQWT